MPPVITTHLSRVILYVRNVERVAAFYQHFFGFTPLPGASDRWVELSSPQGGSTIAVHKANDSHKSGNSVRLAFAIADIAAFKAAAAQEGLRFGVTYDIGDFEFSNAKDPAGNCVQISSRGVPSNP